MSDQVLGLIVPGMSLIFAVAAFVLWMRDRSKTYMLGYIVAPLAIGISLSVNHYAPPNDEAVNRIVVHTFSIIACISVVWASCTRLNKAVPLKTWIAAAFGVVIINTWLVDDQNFMASLFLVNSLCGVIFVTGAQLLSQSVSRAAVDRAMLWVMAIVAVQFFVRPAGVFILEGAVTGTQYRESVGHALLTLSAALLTLMQAAAILATILFDQFRDMQERSESDPLTGLPMRRSFEDDVRKLLSKSDLVNTPVSLVVADVDHFKQVNDLWGHLAGDRALASFGKMMSRTIRASDIAGRIGGEEFCVIVWNCDEAQAARLAERMRQSFAAMQHEGISADVRLTASFGVAQVERGEGYTRAFSRADRALYDAKNSGRNKVVSSSSDRGKDHTEQDRTQSDGERETATAA